MKKISLLLLTTVLFISCKQEEKTNVPIKETIEVVTKTYPKNISKIFEAHGGLNNWNELQSLEFTMPKPNGDEITSTNLKSRESLIKMPSHTLGFDGKDVWLQKKDTTTYKGNPRFYYNLMFYFYAMPFVLADDGIIYKDVKPLIFEDKEYPGILISYENGIGESPEDEYILYYNPETYKMEWLGYTVTYFSKEKSKEFHFIKYSNWQTIEELQLPKTLTWYNYENNLPTTKRNDVEFVNVTALKTKMDNSMFAKPEDAKVIE